MLGFCFHYHTVMCLYHLKVCIVGHWNHQWDHYLPYVKEICVFRNSINEHDVLLIPIGLYWLRGWRSINTIANESIKQIHEPYGGRTQAMIKLNICTTLPRKHTGVGRGCGAASVGTAWNISSVNTADFGSAAGVVRWRVLARVFNVVPGRSLCSLALQVVTHYS